MRIGTWLAVAALIATVVATAACSDASREEAGGAEAAASETTTAAPSTSSVAIVEPSVLRALSAGGFGFGHHFDLDDDASAQALAASPAYRAIADGIGAEIAGIMEKDPKANIGLAYWHRVFDVRWLRSSASRFSLVAVTNRMDRAGASDCGEIRFVYRLEYRDPGEGLPEDAFARMPMTVAVVVPQAQESGSCRAAAQRWLALEGAAPGSLAERAARGPLANLPRATSIETNLQAVRWPPGAYELGPMGGHAEYMLNVWKVDRSTGAPSAVAEPLENTPDVASIANDPRRRELLATWIRSNVDAIEAGTAKLPAELRAKTAYSVGPRGLARIANRPFSRLVDEGALEGVRFDDRTLVKSAVGLVRRLDELSCPGCHQSRGLAGFHVLGEEDLRGGESGDNRLDQLVVGVSPHFQGELAWRAMRVRAIASGQPAETPRPFAEHTEATAGGSGAHCGLGDPSFAGWTCAPGYTCRDVNGEKTVGTCVRVGAARAGDLCEANRVVPAPDGDPLADTVYKAIGGASCDSLGPGGQCSGALGGFPNGTCTATCRKPGEVNGDVVCGTVPPLSFNDCLERGGAFEACMRPLTHMLRAACSRDQPCRDDYACTYVPGAPSGIGQCMPPYFLFQARVDGHDAPTDVR